MRRLLESSYLWFIALDPGFTRLEKASLAMFSFFSAWIITRELLRAIANQLATPEYLKLVLFAPVLSLICSLLITDVKYLARRNSLLLSILPIAAVLVSFTLLPVIPLIYGLILLVLFFLSYYFRRYGIRAMELFLIATITFYFAALLRISLVNLPWLLLTALISVFSVYLWRFILVPYNPARLLRRTTFAYYRLAAAEVTEIIKTLQDQSPFDRMKNLEIGGNRLSHCRKVIESEIGALSPPAWTRERTDRLRIDFYNAEQGLTLMVQAVSNLRLSLVQLPEDLLRTLMKTLSELQQVLIKVAAPQSVEALQKQYGLLRESINLQMKADPNNAWALPALRLIAGGSQLNQAVQDSRDLLLKRDILKAPASTPDTSNADPDKNPGGILRPQVRMPGRLNRLNLKTWHPTTLLGLQATLAALLGMLIGYYFSLDHSNWVFWTAFVVIAGSTGESLRRMSFRIAGTVIGVVAGILISLILINLNTGSLPMIGLVAVCLFLAAYFIDTSYVWMIFWINIAITLLFIGLGGTVSDILINRPLNTFIGAFLAAIVVLFILPIRTRERFKRTLVVFLDSLDSYISGYTEKLSGKSSANFESANVQVNSEFSRLEQTFPSLALEYNPLARAQNPILPLTTTLQSLKMDLSHMTQDMVSGLMPSFSKDINELVITIKIRISENLLVITNLLNRKPAGEVLLLTDLFARANQVPLLEKALRPEVEENPAAETHVLIYLARVNQALYQLYSGISENFSR